MTPRRLAASYGVLYGLRAAVFVLGLHEHLVPDTLAFAAGRSSWSSLAAATLGALFGRPGVDALAIAASAALGALLGLYTPRWWLPGLLALSPPGWYLIQASADAAGSLAALILYRKGRSRRERLLSLGAVAAFHAEAALVFALVSTVGGTRRRITLAGLAGGGIACGLMVDWQARYFLPGLTLAIGAL